jgi:hypothetical protein
LEDERELKRRELDAKFNSQQLRLEPFELTPRKADVEVDQVALVWLPWRVDADGRGAPVYCAPSRDPATKSSDGNNASQCVDSQPDETLPIG